MIVFLTTLHIMLCFALILVILLQPGKEGAAVFGGGGGGNQMYGPRGQANLLTKVTTTGAAMFMFTSISLAWFSNEGSAGGSEVEDAIERQAAKNNFKRTSATSANIRVGEAGAGSGTAVPTPVAPVTPAPVKTPSTDEAPPTTDVPATVEPAVPSEVSPDNKAAPTP